MKNYTEREHETSLFGFEGQASIWRARLVLQTGNPILMGFTIAAGFLFLWMVLG
ncbi:hypothetical protein [Phaeobacter gallaeciensis]|uniref:hypothetical protein n=1 Tax=Phaeobacter gallaeciensis TaxID=60890 RepID=UPI00237FCA61|nr:hypothetical protein [Phaeobacter gallaeciensis]MDE4189652.1 hypothetical protein [Phaeobacter gallaeciensis]MDE4198804.1 hypothetical protein [Phaeobacter gallaeciensis]MDE4202950.1 hypothetical protein [Phaeobacter gallaeciensis]MDE4207093.1 hypothetical protein [Phaeobacter gallaeciensis]MDE4215682.1 hypothetical protein [Phaeobacter gallaeciensis]